MNGGEVVFHFKGDDKDLDKKTSQLGSKLGNIGKSIGGAFLKGTAVAGASLTAMVGASVKAFANVEQSIGGVETLFKDSASTVIANAKKAYTTAGVSANDYMEQVTSFSASLLQSLGGDTAKAAEYADRAIVDMSDNANKMGTSMEMIQNAYQGFAKQNYTMLDNLKLGYGGTKEEMARLIKDASKMTDVQKELNVSVKDGDMSFGNIVNAISVMQKKMGIAGTTTKEASETISGSINSAKASFQNFLAGTGSIDQVISTFSTAGKNIMKAIVKMAPDIIDGIVTLINAIVPQIPSLVEALLPTVINGISSLISGLAEALPELLKVLMDTLIEQGPIILQTLMDSVLDIVYSLSDTLPTLIPQIVKAIMTLLPVLLSNMPAFMKAGIELIMAVINGLVDSIPILIDMLPDLIEELVNGLISALPMLLGVGMAINIKLAQAIIKAVPKLISSIPKIINSLVEGFKKGVSNFAFVGKSLIDGLGSEITTGASQLGQKILTSVTTFFTQTIPSIFNGFVSFLASIPAKIGEFVQGVISFIGQIPYYVGYAIGYAIGLIASIPFKLWEILTSAVEKIKEFGISIWTWITVDLPQIIQGIINWFAQLPGRIWSWLTTTISNFVTWLGNMKTKAVEGIKKVANSIVNGFKSLPDKIFNVGKNLIRGLWNGITGMKDWISGKVKGFASGVINGFKKSFGVHSPSREFAIIGRFNMLGLEKGMEDMQPDLQKSINGMFDLSPSLYGSTSNNLSPNINVTVNNNMKQDPLGQMINDVKTVSGGSKYDYNYGMGV